MNDDCVWELSSVQEVTSFPSWLVSVLLSTAILSQVLFGCEEPGFVTWKQSFAKGGHPDTEKPNNGSVLRSGTPPTKNTYVKSPDSEKRCLRTGTPPITTLSISSDKIKHTSFNVVKK